jgi:hypothetical protein
MFSYLNLVLMLQNHVFYLKVMVVFGLSLQPV